MMKIEIWIFARERVLKFRVSCDFSEQNSRSYDIQIFEEKLQNDVQY